MVERISPVAHTIESRVTVPPYDHLKDGDPKNPGAQFKEWVSKNSEKFFNRFAAYTFSTLQKLNARNPGKIDVGDFIHSLMPEKRLLNSPYPVAKFNEEMQKLNTEFSGDSSDHTQANTFLKGTTEYFPNVKFTNARKVYVNPPLESAANFARAFYKSIEALKVPIHGSKIHTEGMVEDDSGESYVRQGHNTFVVYLADDRTMPYLLQAISHAEKESGIQLHSFEKADVPKAPTLLGGKVILGGADIKHADDRETRSFDTWTDGVANAARQAFLKNPNLTEAETLQVMTTELARRTGKEAKEYMHSKTS